MQNAFDKREEGVLFFFLFIHLTRARVNKYSKIQVYSLYKKKKEKDEKKKIVSCEPCLTRSRCHPREFLYSNVFFFYPMKGRSAREYPPPLPSHNRVFVSYNGINYMRARQSQPPCCYDRSLEAHLPENLAKLLFFCSSWKYSRVLLTFTTRLDISLEFSFASGFVDIAWIRCYPGCCVASYDWCFFIFI